MEKRKHLYWTPCAAHCIDVILEELGDLPQHKNALSKAKKITKFIYNYSWVLALMKKFSKKEIIRPATTRFATSYLTLQSILDVRQPLETMFTSTHWLNSEWGKKPERKEIRRQILNDKFWASVTYAILSTRPLVQVLRLVDAEKKPAIVEWWTQFGDSTPELQSFAVRVLGFTCSSSGCERNWSTYSQVQTKRRNRLSTLRMNSFVYIIHNKRLRDRRLRNKGLKNDEHPLVCDDVASDNEWFIDDETDLPLSDLQLEDLSVDVLRGEAD
ncbi:hypothetical protein M5K25_006896 [Dendrobium thyrsiflorum]|uniref:HAT C-terminal dimerisation domain-containing protein n=1 Tax=Dendrobium thyrsiflorum TaxID=117978 RepID=A0ABD0VDU2_DENTH